MKEGWILKVVMINDCSHVGETILKYLPEDFEKTHIKRGRGSWNKTFGLAYNILKAQGAIYHVHYLLQDCYLAMRFGKHPVVGHAHGSDLRETIDHKVWGRIVRHNLKNCHKILVSTPDLLDKARKFSEGAEYLPNPVDTSVFYPKSLPKKSNARLRVLIGSSNDWKFKGTDVAIHALSRVKERVETHVIRYGPDFEKTINLANSLKLPLIVLPKVSHKKIREYYWGAHVIIDQFRFGVLGMVSLEAIACGRPVITCVSSALPDYEDFPLHDINTEEKIASLVMNADLPKLKEGEYSYLCKHHLPDRISDIVSQTYSSAVT